MESVFLNSTLVMVLMTVETIVMKIIAVAILKYSGVIIIDMVLYS